MRYSDFQRPLAGCIGVFIASSLLAMPPAPPGPYRSIEDGFIRAEPTPEPASTKPQPTTDKQATSDKARDWSWGTPSIRYLRQNEPALKMPDDGYPPVRQNSGSSYHPNGAPR